MRACAAVTGLFAPGEQCSAAAALGMAYFFVLKSQGAFDVRWCRGNVGEKIFQPWARRPCLPPSLPPCLPACLPAYLPACLPASLALPAS